MNTNEAQQIQNAIAGDTKRLAVWTDLCRRKEYVEAMIKKLINTPLNCSVSNPCSIKVTKDGSNEAVIYLWNAPLTAFELKDILLKMLEVKLAELIKSKQDL